MIPEAARIQLELRRKSKENEGIGAVRGEESQKTRRETWHWPLEQAVVVGVKNRVAMSNGQKWRPVVNIVLHVLIVWVQTASRQRERETERGVSVRPT